MRNLIFDLGGVIIDLSVDRTIQAFSKLSGCTPEQILQRYHTNPEFLAYETGEISDDEFRKAVQRIFSFEADNDKFDQAWNSMLVALPRAKLDLLEQLKGNLSLTVLSNTNNIHLGYVNSVMIPAVSLRSKLDDYFDHHYYSHLVGKRKPDPAIFHQVLIEKQFDPAETLFLDDNEINIKAAREAGISARLVEHPDQVFEYVRANDYGT